MTGLELIRKLEESGTGKLKLEVAAACVRAKPAATDEDVYEAMHLHATDNRDVGYQGTLDKAAEIMRTGDWKPAPEPASTVADKLAAELSGEKPKERPPVTFDAPTLAERDAKSELESLRADNAKLKAKLAKPDKGEVESESPALTTEPSIAPKPVVHKK